MANPKFYTVEGTAAQVASHNTSAAAHAGLFAAKLGKDEVDTSLSVSGNAADAKAVGDLFGFEEWKSDFEEWKKDEPLKYTIVKHNGKLYRLADGGDWTKEPGTTSDWVETSVADIGDNDIISISARTDGGSKDGILWKRRDRLYNGLSLSDIGAASVQSVTDAQTTAEDAAAAAKTAQDTADGKLGRKEQAADSAALNGKPDTAFVQSFGAVGGVTPTQKDGVADLSSLFSHRVTSATPKNPTSILNNSELEKSVDLVAEAYCPYSLATFEAGGTLAQGEIKNITLSTAPDDNELGVVLDFNDSATSGADAVLYVNAASLSANVTLDLSAKKDGVTYDFVGDTGYATATAGMKCLFCFTRIAATTIVVNKKEY